MPIAPCPNCGHRIRLRTDQAGENVRCPQCGQTAKCFRRATPPPPGPSRPDLTDLAGQIPAAQPVDLVRDLRPAC